MDLTCYLHDGWVPAIRPAPSRRDWMDDTPGSFAYRCLPLGIANAHGWEVLNPAGFAARWNGGTGVDAVTLRFDDDTPVHLRAVSLFGQGILTFHIPGIVRTPAGWNLWVTGSPNRAKDGIAPLSAVVETDWSPFTFTMNWRFTRAGEWVRFDTGEPICFFFPVERGAVERFVPCYRPLSADATLAEQFAQWNVARIDFHAAAAASPPAEPADKWQKHYYRGTDASDCRGATDHATKLRLRPFGDPPGRAPTTTT